MSIAAGTVVYDHQIFSLQQFGGISRYFCEIAKRIPAVSPFATRVIAPIHFNEYLSMLAVDKLGVFRPIRFRGAGRLYRGFNRAVAPLLMRASGPRLVHWTYFTPVKADRRSKTVVTVYDMIHELFSSEFASDDCTSRNKQRCVEVADHVVCISESTKADLIRLFGVPEEKISVTHLGYSEAFTPVRGTADDAMASSRPYLLHVGQRRTYKGFANAVRAYASSQSVRDAFDFVAFGGPAFDRDELDLLRSLGLREGSVRRIVGGDAALAAAYRGARAFVYASHYEGFGIPPLEAMACGCPVTCSNTSSIPEVVGTAAELFDPHRVDAIGAALERVCFDEALRSGLVESGLQRSRRFSWDRCAEETASVYRRLIAA